MLIPPLQDIALAATAVGVLFLMRFLLTVRRIRAPLAGRDAFWTDATRIGRPMVFGAAAEPDRRHALRQLVFGAAIGAFGLAVYAYLLVASVLTPFVHRGMSV